MKLMILGLKAGAFCLLLAVLFGFAGALHPAFDSLSLLRLPLAVLCLLVLVFPMGVRLRLMLAAAVLLGAGTTVPMLVGTADADDLRIYSKNMWFGNRELDALAADIRDSGADVVTLQEVSPTNRPMLADLRDIYPHQHLCSFSGWNGIAVLSREPIVQTKCSHRRAVAAAQINMGQGPVWVASVHLSWPFPYGNARSAEVASDVLETLESPVVMAGDFNIFPWAQSVQSMQHAAALRVAQPVRPTFDLRGVPLLLDHVHAPGGGTAQYRGLLGSDHLGVLADVSLTR
ncbi:endonuclease/exonuclease/phosphatase family protein [Roseobacter sp. CCS2]|uniref:endonuclease/exonuclease/phosphatase family protein n=1 Tax=Roseobacter sp. CCS2 TaxID=391593 RepID=UPI0000F40552|nr:endonuclease/exonuclease/phosphatase family protein [Roseobacter sp. CCS2]EBA11403.1 Endonuclease/exonuclease/phosphatase [Roseobacter sp. CCS2]